MPEQVHSNQILQVMNHFSNIDESKDDPPRIVTQSPQSTDTSNFFLKFHRKYLGPTTDRRKKYIILIGCIIGLLILLCAIVLFILFGLVPCLLTKCHTKASVCINRAFNALCICDHGFNGNGREYCDECGITSNTPNIRIVGGSEAVAYSWPSSALVIASYKTDYTTKKGLSFKVEVSFLCGGTLINRKSILTAAHCILKEFDYDYKGESYSIKVKPNKYYPTLESMYKVYLGVHNRTVLLTNNISPAIAVSVEKIIIHDDYDEEDVKNDISILKLKKIVELNEYIQLACLPNLKWNKNFPIPQTTAYILGWGTISEGGPTPDTLKNAKITIYDGIKCNKVISENKKIWDSLICAGDVNGGTDTCQGDSGGSIFVRDTVNNKPKFISAGIVSYGDGCAKKDKPGLYTRIIYFLDWINDKANF